MSSPVLAPPGPPTEGPRRRGWARDWRVWLGIGVTAAALYLTLRDVEPQELWRTLAGANPWLVVAMLPVHVIVLWVRALRWRYLTEAISAEPLPRGALFRATAVGFMALNILPLRIGELVRPWALARETGVRTTAAFGTVVMERAFDFTCVALIGGLVLFFHTQTLPAWVRTGAMVIAGISLIPFALTLALRIDEARALGLAARALSPLPRPIADRTLDILAQLARGLASLRSWHDLAMVLLHSLLLWGVLIAAPFALGLGAFGISLGPGQAVLAVYTALAFTALAVAAPSAPGFFGVYHFACREALVLFGVSPAVAVGYGTVVHLAYWVPVTVVGLLSLTRSGLQLSELTAPSFGKAGAEAHR